MRRKSLATLPCPIARSLEIVGEWWTLLIVRDAIAGARRFEEFRRTGIADNILSARLELLVREGVLERRAYQEHPPRHEYVLTEKGRDLLPVLVSLAAWGMKWTEGPIGTPPTEAGRQILALAAGRDLLNDIEQRQRAASGGDGEASTDAGA